MSYASPIDAARAGDGLPSDLRVVALVETGAFAGVVFTSETWRQPEAVICQKTDSGWEVISEGSGLTRWTLTDDATDRGVLFCWGPAEDPGVTAYDVEFRGRTWRVLVQNGHYAYLVPDVDEQAFDDPADFTAIF